MALSNHHARPDFTAFHCGRGHVGSLSFLPQASDWIRSMAVRHSIDLNELLEGVDGAGASEPVFG